MEHKGSPFNFFLSNHGHAFKKLESFVATALIFVHIASPITSLGWDYWSIAPANAVLYSPDTKVPRTGELALRRAIPANTNMKAIQVISHDSVCLWILSHQISKDYLNLLIGIIGGHLVLTENTTEKALWNHGG